MRANEFIYNGNKCIDVASFSQRNDNRELLPNARRIIATNIHRGSVSPTKRIRNREKTDPPLSSIDFLEIHKKAFYSKNKNLPSIYKMQDSPVQTSKLNKIVTLLFTILIFRTQERCN